MKSNRAPVPTRLFSSSSKLTPESLILFSVVITEKKQFQLFQGEYL
jgi:hypothetical protein